IRSKDDRAIAERTADDLFVGRCSRCRPDHSRRYVLGLIQLEAGETNDLGPLFSFFRDETAEVRGRPREYVAAELAHARLYGGIGGAGRYIPPLEGRDCPRRGLVRPQAPEAPPPRTRRGNRARRRCLARPPPS